MTDDRDELIVLIHGTFAAAEADEGSAWWQRGSRTWQALRGRLPPGLSLQNEGGLFRWSAENTEWARESASRQLLDELVRYEEEGRPYHLIAHSHGGTVAWAALKNAVRRKIELRHLGSWATVGTPFLQYAPSPPSWAPRVVWWAWLLIGGLLAAMPLVALLVVAVMYDLSIGSYWVQFAFVWLGSAGAAICSPPLYLLAKARDGRRESRRVVKELAIARDAMRLYGERWLGIWSTEDEAIAGLHHTVGFQATLIKKLFFVTEVPFDHGKKNATAALARRSGWLDRFILSRANRLVCASLASTLQGNDRPGTEVDGVTVGPIAADPAAYPPLPRYVEATIIASANAAAREAVPKLRSAFGLSMLGSQGVWQWVQGASSALAGQELVHTSYFDSPAVLELLRLHIDAHRASKGGNDTFSASLLAWYQASRQALRQHVLGELLATKKAA